MGSYLDASRARWPCSRAKSCASTPTVQARRLVGISRWDQELADAGIRLLKELRYWGVSQVEFKRDARDGRYRLMEVNARHWKWHSLAAACGVNLSYAAYRDAIGQPFVAPRQIDGPKWVVATKDALSASSLDACAGSGRRPMAALVPRRRSTASSRRGTRCPARCSSARQRAQTTR